MVTIQNKDASNFVQTEQWNEITMEGPSAAGACRALRFVFCAKESKSPLASSGEHLYILGAPCLKKTPLQKFLKAAKSGVAECGSDPFVLVGVVVHYEHKNIWSCELDLAQECSYVALTALVPKLQSVLQIAGSIQVLDHSAALHQVLATASQRAALQQELQSVHQLMCGVPVASSRSSEELHLLGLATGERERTARLLPRLEEDPSIIEADLTKLLLMCAVGFLDWLNEIEQTLGSQLTPRAPGLSATRHAADSAAFTGALIASNDSPAARLAQFLNGKLIFLIGKLQAGQEPNRQQLAQFFRGMAETCGKASQAVADDLLNVLYSNFDAIGWDLYKNASKSSEPPTCQAVLQFLNRLIVELLPYCPAIAEQSKAPPERPALRQAVLLAGGPPPAALMDTLLKRLAYCAELAQCNMDQAYVEHVSLRGQPVGIIFYWRQPHATALDGRRSKLENLLRSHLLMAVSEFSDTGLVYFQPSGGAGADVPQPSNISVVSWSEIAADAVVPPVPPAQQATLAPTDDEPHRQLVTHAAAAGEWSACHTQLLAMLADYHAASGLRVELLPVAEVLSFGWYKLCAPAAEQPLSAFLAGPEAGVDYLQWRAAVLDHVRQCFLYLDLSEMLAGMLEAPARTGKWLLSGCTNAEAGHFDGVENYAQVCPHRTPWLIRSRRQHAVRGCPRSTRYSRMDLTRRAVRGGAGGRGADGVRQGAPGAPNGPGPLGAVFT
jgi:hypothetical protein